GSDGDAHVRAEPGQRPAEVALDVVIERLQRRHVEDAQPLARRSGEPVERIQEGGERLSGAGRRLDQHVSAGRDRGPAELLRGRRRRERALEPGARRRRKDVQRLHSWSVLTRMRLTGAPRAERQDNARRSRSASARSSASGIGGGSSSGNGNGNSGLGSRAYLGITCTCKCGSALPRIW